MLSEKFSHDKNNKAADNKAVVSFFIVFTPAMYAFDIMGGAWITWHHHLCLIIDLDQM